MSFIGASIFGELTRTELILRAILGWIPQAGKAQTATVCYSIPLPRAMRRKCFDGRTVDVLQFFETGKLCRRLRGLRFALFCGEVDKGKGYDSRQRRVCESYSKFTGALNRCCKSIRIYIGVSYEIVVRFFAI